MGFWPYSALCCFVGLIGYCTGWNALTEGMKANLGPTDLLLTWWNGFGAITLTSLMQAFVVMYTVTVFLRLIKCLPPDEIHTFIGMRYMAMNAVLPKGDAHSPLRIANTYYLLGTIVLIVAEQAIRSSRPSVFSLDNPRYSFYGIVAYLCCASLAYNTLSSTPDELDLKSYPMLWYFKLRAYYVVVYGVVNAFGFLLITSKYVIALLMKYDLSVEGTTTTISEGLCCLITVMVHCTKATTEPDHLAGFAFLLYAFLRREAIPDRTIEPLGSAVTYWFQVRYLQQLPVSVPSNDTCPICLDPLTEKTPILPCGHAAHRLCLRQWIFQHPKCPFCNQPVLFTRWHNHDVCSSCPTGRIRTWCTLCGEPTCENCIRRVSPTAVCCTACYRREIDSGASRSVSRSVSVLREDAERLSQRSIPRSRSRAVSSRAPSVTAADDTPSPAPEPRLPSRSPDR